MKKHIIIILGLAFAALLSPHVRAESFTVTFSQSDFEITRRGDTISVAARNGDFIPTDNPEGPSLPSTSRRILNPIEMQASKVDVTCVKTLVASDVVMVANGYPVINDGTFDDVADPITLASASELDAVKIGVANGLQNGYGFSYYQIMPYLYDAERKELYFVSEVTFTPSFSLALLRGGSSTPTVYRREMVDFSDALSVTALTSYASVEEVALNSRATAERIDYAIITTDSLKAAFDELVRWKRMKGLYTKVFTTEEIYAADNTTTDKPLKIKRFLYNLYKDNGLQYVLLGGDHPAVPTKMVFYQIKFKDMVLRRGYMASDLYYGCFDTDFEWSSVGSFEDESSLIEISNADVYPEIELGRLPAKSQSEVSGYIKKIKEFELPTGNTDYISKFLLAGNRLETTDDLYYSQTYFQQKYLRDQVIIPNWGGNTDMLVDLNSNNIYGMDYGGNALKQLINESYIFINIRDHGSATAINSSGVEYNNNDANSQRNFPGSIITTVACHTNDFCEDVSLSEALICNNRGGAIIYIGPSGFGIYDDNIQSVEPTRSDRMNYQFYKNLLSSYKSGQRMALGSAFRVAKNSMAQADNSYYYRYLTYGTNYLGDPELGIFSTTPDKITASHSFVENDLWINFNNDGVEYTAVLSPVGSVQKALIKTTGNNSIGFGSITYPCNIHISAFNKIPLIITPTSFNKLILENCVLNETVTYRAKEIVLGENVTVKSGARLELDYVDKITIKNAVKCEKGAELKINHVTTLN